MSAVKLAPKVLIADARKALESDWSTDRLQSLHAQLKQLVAERAARLKAITAKDGSTFGNAPGPERQKVVATGDIEALRRLDSEERDLAPELEVLRDLQGNLRRRLDETIGRDYAAGMQCQYATVEELAATVAEAQAALRKSRQALEAKLNDIRAQRHHVVRQNSLNGQRLELPAADPALLRQYMAVQGYTYHRGPDRVGWFAPSGGPQQLKNVAETLGLGVPRPERESAAA